MKNCGWGVSIAAALLLWGRCPKQESAQQKVATRPQQDFSPETSTFLGRYGTSLDQPEDFRKQIGALYDEAAVLCDRHAGGSEGSTLSCVREAMRAILLFAPGSGQIHDAERARLDPQFKKSLERDRERSVAGLQKEALRLREEGKASRGRALIHCAVLSLGESTLHGEELNRFAREQLP